MPQRLAAHASQQDELIVKKGTQHVRQHTFVRLITRAHCRACAPPLTINNVSRLGLDAIESMSNVDGISRSRSDAAGCRGVGEVDPVKNGVDHRHEHPAKAATPRRIAGGSARHAVDVAAAHSPWS